MPEMVNYIFGSLERSAQAIRRLEAQLRFQTRVSRDLAIAAAVMAVYISIQNKKIDKLGREVKGLRAQKETKECNA